MTHEPQRAEDELQELHLLVIGMRFPLLLVGSLATLLSLSIFLMGMFMFWAAISAQGTEFTLLMGMSGFYTLAGMLYCVPGILLLRSGLLALLARGDLEKVRSSLHTQLWFWRVMAFYTLGTIGLYALLAVVLVGGSLFLVR